MLHHCDLCHIDLDRISVRRGGQVLLQDVSMHIHCGQLTVLIGQNGAGKTTLIRALLGQIPHTGVIRHVDSRGLDIPHLRTGYVPQVLQFDREMPLTVQDFLAASLSKRPVWPGVTKKMKETVRQALAEPAPDLLVLDEPVSGIDRNGLKMFLDTLIDLRRTRHMAILLVSHDLRFVREYADHVVLLEKNVLTQGTPGEVFASPEFEAVFGTGEEEDA